MGRFINADAYASTGQGILGNNMFAYCNNNPVVFTDSTGMLPFGVNPVQVVLFDGGNNRRGSNRRRDVTNEVVSALTKAASEARTKNVANKNGSVSTASIYNEFYNLVNHEAPWDIKRQQPWENTIKTPYPGNYDVEVTFCGNIMTPEKLGNFTFGYLGYAYGIPKVILLVGSYYAAGFPVYWDDLSNELNDWRYINMGYEYAKNGYLEGMDV